MTTATRTRRSSEDWKEIAQEILAGIQDGKRFEDYDELIGTNRAAVKVQLALMGRDSKGEPFELVPITGSRPATVAKRVAKRRREGAPWWELIAATGMSYNDLTKMLRDHGYTMRGEAVGNGAS